MTKVIEIDKSLATLSPHELAKVKAFYVSKLENLIKVTKVEDDEYKRTHQYYSQMILKACFLQLDQLEKEVKEN